MTAFNGISLRFTPPDPSSPAGKLANCDVCFGVTDDLVRLLHEEVIGTDIGDRLANEGIIELVDAMRLLNGLRFVEFSIWETRTGRGRYVRLPARSFRDSANRPRHVPLVKLHDIGDGVLHQEHLDRLNSYILAGFDAWEKSNATANKTAAVG